MSYEYVSCIKGCQHESTVSHIFKKSKNSWSKSLELFSFLFSGIEEEEEVEEEDNNKEDEQEEEEEENVDLVVKPTLFYSSFWPTIVFFFLF